MSQDETTRRLKEHMQARGADLIGVADLAPFKQGDMRTIPPDLMDPFTSAISMAVALDDEVMDGITNRPTPAYASLYRSANARLDALAAEAVGFIEARGARAMAVPASRILDEEALMGAISHKAVARMAGLGWQGKSLLIVSPAFGPRIRLVTVLTDLGLTPDGPIENRCGDCLECHDACPIAVIYGMPAEDRYLDRNDAIGLRACNLRTMENSEPPEIAARICGACVKACPHGRGGR